MEKLFELKTKYTLDEHIKYNFAVALRSKEMLTIGVLWLLIIVGGIISQELYIIIFGILFPIIYMLVIYTTAKNNYTSNKMAQNAEITIEFYKDNLVQKTEAGSYKIEHDKILKIIETKTHFYVMIAKNQGVILPKEKMSKEMIEYVKNVQIRK